MRTSSYICTLLSYDEEKIAAIRELVTKTNLLNKLVNRRDRWSRPVRYRLMIRPRLGRNNPAAHLYRPGGNYYRLTSQVIRREHGSRFDLYLQRR